MFFTSVKYPLLLMALLWSVNASAYRPSPADCAAEADRAARDNGTVMGGATHGAVKGAVFGAIVGGGESARRGAAVGAVAGGVHRGAERNDVYERVYDDCMRGRRY